MKTLVKTFAICVPLTAMICLVPLAHAQLPSTQGTIFLDLDENGQFSTGEALLGVGVDLYLDDGDGIFDSAFDTFVSSDVTDVNGFYSFAGLNPAQSYFVHQGSQTVDDTDLGIVVSDLIDAGQLSVVLDSFDSQQSVEANPLVLTDTLSMADSAVIGGERDLHVEHMSGPAEATLRSNPYGLDDVLEFSHSAGNIAVATVTWDGLDSGTGGLGGMDLTADGAIGFAMYLGVDAAGAGETLTLSIFTGADQSSAEIAIPVTDGNASVFQMIPYSDLVGTASVDNVDAIQIELGGHSTSIDARLAEFGLYGPSVNDLLNLDSLAAPVPEPSSILIALFGFVWLLGARGKRK